MASIEHDELKKKALVWLRNRATRKGVRSATEVTLNLGYVADAVALCSFQWRFWMTYSPQYKNQVALNLSQPYKAITAQKCNVNYFACVFEVKTNRADFLRTFGPNADQRRNRQKPIGSLHWCICPKGLIKPDELPDFWGLLITSGAGLKEIKKPAVIEIPETQFDKFAHHLLWAISKRRKIS